jgi:hypothetical protein
MPNPAYPTLPIAGDSKRILRDGRNDDQIGDGSTRVRKLFPDKYDFELHHPSLVSGDQTTLQNFYNTNQTVSAIDLVWPEDGLTYVVIFRKDAVTRTWKPGSRRDYVVRLGGV